MQAVEKTGEAAPIRAAVSENFPYGLERKTLQALADRMGRKIEFFAYPFSRRLASLEKGTIDISAGVLKTPQRLKDIIFIEANKRQTNRAFFILKDGPVTIETYEDLYGLKVGTRTKSLYFDRFDKDERLTKIPVRNIEAHIKMLFSGRIDTFVFMEKSALRKIRELRYTGQVIAAPYKFTRNKTTHISLSKNSPLIRDQAELTRIIREMTLDGTFDKIVEDYYR